VARLPELRLDTLDPDALGSRRTRHGSAAVDAQPHRARPVRRAHRDGGSVGDGVRGGGQIAAVGGVAGIIGAVIGTLGGRTARARLAAVSGTDPPAALIEDAVAILAALLIVTVIS